ncbi:hypothetical protein MY11210_001264 [Beauveria gryllotalpidicola]
MPCFKGIAVSVHANGTPLPEYGMQKQSRLSRISTYIPVPQPSISDDPSKPEPAKFAISITLLTPGLPIPYSAPKPTEANPYPKPRFVGGALPGIHGGGSLGYVNAYVPMTNSENETIAAYIYFDGRAKEEVATLLRPGEETWVNSRWVQVPDSEGGGLAEREFLFREVGLERWLNGLDLQGHDAAEKLEKRRQKFQRRQQRQSMSLEGPDVGRKKRGTLKYGADDGSPIEAVYDYSESSSDDDEPPEATGQIKVAMFRVLASGEIKKGEYSPQFDAHDGDEEGSTEKSGIDADVEHTTSFAKPKTLDPKTISTQTVTGIDGPDKPFAVFTFFYRGDRQLQKIGVMQSEKTQTPAGSAKRRSGQLDFSNLGPLKAGGTVGFSAFRDHVTEASRRRKSRKKSNGLIADDSDDDDDSDGLVNMDQGDEKDEDRKLAPEDAKSQGELADGVNRIHLKRAHSTDPDANSAPSTPQLGSNKDTLGELGSSSVQPIPAPSGSAHTIDAISADANVGSPLKKARASVDQGVFGGEKYSNTQSLSAALGSVVSTSAPNVIPAASEPKPTATEEEEL